MCVCFLALGFIIKVYNCKNCFILPWFNFSQKMLQIFNSLFIVYPLFPYSCRKKCWLIDTIFIGAAEKYVMENSVVKEWFRSGQKCHEGWVIFKGDSAHFNNLWAHPLNYPYFLVLVFYIGPSKYHIRSVIVSKEQFLIFTFYIFLSITWKLIFALQWCQK